MTRDASIGRTTPYEMVFAGGLADRHFGAISEETEGRPDNKANRDSFARLDSVAGLVQELVPDDADAASFDRSLDLIYHCYHFWRAHCPLFALDDAVVRSLIEDAPDLSGWAPGTQHAALYLELPRNLMWAAVTEAEAPEPVEGFFVRVEPEPAVSVLMVLGMWPQRAGFSVAEVKASLSELVGVEEQGAFRSEIPGADRAGLYSLQRPLETLLLAFRILWYVDRYPESAEPRRADESDGLTGLEHVVLHMVERSRG